MVGQELADRWGQTFTPSPCGGGGPEADLSITVADDPDPVEPGAGLTYTVTVMNAGPDDAEGVSVATILPAAVALTASGNCAEDPAGAPTCTLGTIASGTQAEFK